MTEFNYDGLFAANAPVTTRAANRHARYDFAVAYPDPDTLPLDGLADALRTALEREGRDLAYYPVAAGYPPLRELVAEKLRRDRQMTVSLPVAAGYPPLWELVAEKLRGDRQMTVSPEDIVLTRPPIAVLAVLPESQHRPALPARNAGGVHGAMPGCAML